MNDFTTNQSQRSMVGSYSKDIICKLIEQGLVDFEGLKLEYDKWYDHILGRLTEGQITDRQLQFIEDLFMMNKSIPEEFVKHTKLTMMHYTREEASRTIDMIFNFITVLPEEYRDMLAKKESWEAVKNLADRDDFKERS